MLGDRGETQIHRLKKSESPEFLIKTLLSKPISEGYVLIDLNEHARLLIEYRIDGMETVQDLDKRHALERPASDLLGWTGLGHCDGGSIGSGTMEVCCYVVDYDLAKKIVEEKLSETDFCDYTRIYRD